MQVLCYFYVVQLFTQITNLWFAIDKFYFIGSTIIAHNRKRQNRILGPCYAFWMRQHNIYAVWEKACIGNDLCTLGCPHRALRTIACTWSGWGVFFFVNIYHWVLAYWSEPLYFFTVDPWQSTREAISLLILRGVLDVLRSEPERGGHRVGKFWRSRNRLRNKTKLYGTE